MNLLKSVNFFFLKICFNNCWSFLSSSSHSFDLHRLASSNPRSMVLLRLLRIAGRRCGRSKTPKGHHQAIAKGGKKWEDFPEPTNPAGPTNPSTGQGGTESVTQGYLPYCPSLAGKPPGGVPCARGHLELCCTESFAPASLPPILA